MPITRSSRRLRWLPHRPSGSRVAACWRLSAGRVGESPDRRPSLRSGTCYVIMFYRMCTDYWKFLARLTNKHTPHGINECLYIEVYLIQMILVWTFLFLWGSTGVLCPLSGYYGMGPGPSLSFILTDENQQIDDDAISQTEMARCNPLPLQRRKCSIWIGDIHFP